MELFNYRRADIDALRELLRFYPPCCCILAILEVLILESPWFCKPDALGVFMLLFPLFKCIEDTLPIIL